ncbi:hypothetical protein FRC01_012617, partial [Tulasnella sp. 417]
MDPRTSPDQFQIASPLRSNFRQPKVFPVEIWVKIFLLLLPPPSHAQAPHKTTLSLVCRFWNEVIESTPILWSGISIQDDIPYVRRSLVKSKESAIDIHGIPTISGASLSLDRLSQFLHEVNRHAGRWRHVALQVMVNQKHDTSFTALPHLQSIKLCSQGVVPVSHGYLTLLDTSSRHTPHLREISFNGMTLAHWDIPFPPNLSTLDLQCVFTSGPSSLELLSILASCPNLANLRLLYVFSRLKDHEVVNQTNVPPIVVELAALQKLTLQNVSSLLVRDLLSQLRFPDDCAVSVSCRISDWNPIVSFVETALSRYRKTLICAEESRQFTISVLRFGLRLIAISKLWNIDLNLGQTEGMREVLAWFGVSTESSNDHRGSLSETSSVGFVEAPHKENDTHITLELFDIALKSYLMEDIASILDLQGIRKIKSTTTWDLNHTLLFSHLSTHRPPTQQMTPVDISELAESYGPQTHSTSAWPLPGLRELVLTEPKDYVLRAVIDLVKGRLGDSN